MKIKKFQLLCWREKTAIAELSAENFITVGKRAVARHTRLEKVVLPASLTAVKTGAFKHCKRLKSVTFSDEWNVGISDEVFANCTRLSEVSPFARICSIGKRAFYRCQKLTTPDLGNDLRKIGEEAFRDCVSIDRLILPAGLQTMGEGAFRGCMELADVDLTSGCSVLAPRAFMDCISLREIHFSVDSTDIPAQCFQNCSALTEIDLPLGTQSIGASAFRGCTSLEMIEAQHGLVRIGARAFSDTPNLRSITVPSTLKRLGFAAFGLGKSEEKAVMYVENEYMCRRMRRRLLLCGSSGRVRVVLSGMTVEERKRGRRRATLEQTPVHIFDDPSEVPEQERSEQISD